MDLTSNELVLSANHRISITQLLGSDSVVLIVKM